MLYRFSNFCRVVAIYYAVVLAGSPLFLLISIT